METQSVENKFKFISIAAARCQQLQRGARPRVEPRSRKPTTVAQDEVRQGLVVAREPEVAEPVLGQEPEMAVSSEGVDVE
ncbi:MAG TPA: DNA-directed RNA polymerase subunit omega [Candidatus Polarisedimenticolia bacterium]|nr:DNA-directed RNA polymerase subunit omega [Candidatus Polarisedimenticolia bacterium]